jgi:hypothetical protein
MKLVLKTDASLLIENAVGEVEAGKGFMGSARGRHWGRG